MDSSSSFTKWILKPGTWFLKLLVPVQKIISNSGSILLTRAGTSGSGIAKLDTGSTLVWNNVRLVQ
jgi:hypothetical protein